MPALVTRLDRSRVAGILTVVLTLAAIAVVVFAPLMSTESVTCTTGPVSTCETAPKTSMSAIPLQPRAIGYLIAMAVLGIVVGVTAALGGDRFVRAVLIGATVLLCGSILLGMASIGLFFVPAGVAAIVAVVSSAGASPPRE
jgi:hypothetical protein